LSLSRQFSSESMAHCLSDNGRMATVSDIISCQLLNDVQFVPKLRQKLHSTHAPKTSAVGLKRDTSFHLWSYVQVAEANLCDPNCMCVGRFGMIGH